MESGNQIRIVMIIVVIGAVILASLIAFRLENDEKGIINDSQIVFNFNDDPNINNRYTGSFRGSVKLDKIDISLYDSSMGKMKVEEQPISGANISIPGDAYLVYTDNNSNRKLDAVDTFILCDGGVGDRITIVYRSTGKIVVTCTIA